MAKNTLLSGHYLVAEGAPHNGNGARKGRGTAGVGRARCSCGQLSHELDSGKARRRWHESHKDKIRAHIRATRPINAGSKWKRIKDGVEITVESYDTYHEEATYRDKSKRLRPIFAYNLRKLFDHISG